MNTSSSLVILISLLLTSTATLTWAAEVSHAGNAHPVRAIWDGAIADVHVVNQSLKGSAREGVARGRIHRLELHSVWDDADIVHLVDAEVVFRFRIQGPDRVLMTDLRFRGVEEHTGRIRHGRINGLFSGAIQSDATGGVYIDDIIIGLTGGGRPPLGLLLPAVQ